MGRLVWVGVLVAMAAGCGDCGGDDTTPVDGGADGAADAAGDADTPDGGVDAGPPPPALCDICRRDSDCGEGALCLVLSDGERGCGVPCEGDDDCAGLGAEARCEEEVAGLPLQCRPALGTCVGTEAGAACTDAGDCFGRYDRCVDAEGLGAVCTTGCAVDADCPLGLRRCRDTTDGRVCIPDEQSAAERCRAIAAATGVAECEPDGRCPGGGTCVGSGSLRLCLGPPEGSLEDPCGHFAVPVTVDGAILCLPSARRFHAVPRAVDCGCLIARPGAMLDDAIELVGLGRCDLGYPARLIDLMIPSLAHDPYRLSFTDRILGDWPLAVPFAEHVAAQLDLARGDHPVSFALQAAGPLIDLPPSGGGSSLSDLAEALARLIEAAGGTADRDDLASQVAGLDAALAEDLAGVVAALTDAHRAREAALARIDGPTRERLWEGTSGLFLPALETLDLRRSDLRGALLGDVDLRMLYGAAVHLASAIETRDLTRHAGRAGDLTVETPLGRVAVRGGDAAHTYDDDGWHRTLLLVDLGGNDTYRFPAGATTGIDHGLAVVIDVAGADDYGYDPVPHARDEGPAGHLRLPSDAGGRLDPPAAAPAGPHSLSRISRQGAGRLGIGMLFDLGAGNDTYRSLRMSQGFAALGVGVLYDAGGDDVYHGEAGVQGAAGFGIGLLIDAGGNDRYLAYHAGQGFAHARAIGALWDGGGDDEYVMHPHDVLYWSPQAPGEANSTLGQGMGFGRRADHLPDRTFMSGGLGVLRDVSGADTYRAGVFAQASGYWYGTGMLIDSAGNDTYDAEWYVQSGSAHYAISVFLEEGGHDIYNQDAVLRNVTLGGGHDLSVAWFVDRTGDDQYHAPNLSLGAGNVAGAGFFADGGGTDSYACTSDFSFGNAYVETDDAYRGAIGTLGVFMEAGGTDTYGRPTVPPPANDSGWTQSLHPGEASERGAGLDRSGPAPLGF